MKKVSILIVILLTLIGCGKMEESSPIKEEKHVKVNNVEKEQEYDEKVELIINEEGVTICERINEPKGFTRIEVEEDSFAYYLQNLYLKPHDSKVLYYNGAVKENHGVYEAVVNIDIGKKDLQQCADAIMRLRGEYLYNRGDYDKIHFNLTNGFRVDYNKWIKGYRVMVEGNKTYWSKKTEESNSYEDFRNYMELIFTYAGTLSLAQELEPVELSKMEIGDIFIQGGSPGHAVIVVDMAINQETGKKVYMLAQSYMPAQDIQILVNPKDKTISPWYVLDDSPQIITPEWSFDKTDLMRFSE